MRIVVVSEDMAVRDEVVATLESPSRTSLATDFEHAAIEILRNVPDIAVVHVSCVDDLAVIASLASLNATSATYVIALLGPDLHARGFALAVASGSHDALRMPLGRDELIMRVDARRRLCRWAKAIGPQDEPSVAALRGWQYLDAIVAADLESMLCRRVTIREKSLPTGGSQLATIPMTHPTAQVDLCVSIAADPIARRWLASAMLGDDTAGDDVSRDIMRELANVVGGALKRSVQHEHTTLSTGIPIDSDLSLCGAGARYWEIETEDGGLVGLVADVRRRPNRRVPAGRLAEGMVVVSDVCNGTGVLLLPSGTRLTSTTAERLSRLLGQTIIEVCA